MKMKSFHAIPVEQKKLMVLLLIILCLLLRRVTWWTRHDLVDPEETESEDDFGQDDEDDNQDLDVPLKKKSVGRIMYNWLCGIDDRPKPKLTLKEKEIIKQKMTSIVEEPYAARITLVAAFVITTVITFMFGFFH